ncbi:hypothetical protein M8C21_004044 [Ambrosia artemisiifolia]|uniref:Uncharacterized protein n=1 Tax=Ambrosia artemisiifolia TaxID=4212 RepID=A0AAD5DC72_AMBAR|nr:hypothetical protein M8C21_004044 [Ambrosia artemisiifolia]
MAWWKEMAQHNSKATANPVYTTLNSFPGKQSSDKQENAATIIQSHFRRLVKYRNYTRIKNAVSSLQAVIRVWKQATTKIQSYYRGFLSRKSYSSQKQAATKIQSYYRGWLSRKSFLKKKQSVMKLQRLYQSIKRSRNFRQSKLEIMAAITIQSHTRRWIARRVACRCKCSIVLIQRFWRGWLTRRDFLLQKEAATSIQSALRCLKCFKDFKCHKNAAIAIQRFVKGWIIRKRLLESAAISGCHHNPTKDCFSGHEIKLNKEDAYFVAADVLKNICSNKKGVEGLRVLKALVKRLHNLVEDLKRKACNEKRNQRTPATKEPMDRRLKEAIQILKLITNG